MQNNTQNIRKNYWSKKGEMTEKAKIHQEEMKKYAEETNNSVKNSLIFSFTPTTLPDPINSQHTFVNQDTVSALFDQRVNKTCVLNFASYKNPGGGYLNGSKAQEEMLCHSSNLYDILKNFPSYYEWNNQNKNKALYTNRAIYTPDVLFFKDNEIVKCDVLTCAAPNIYAANKYCRIEKGENEKIVKNRIKFIYGICDYMNVSTFITGAWGCGVFGQDPELIARTFRTTPSSIPHIIYAVPGDDNNARVFANILAVERG